MHLQLTHSAAIMSPVFKTAICLCGHCEHGVSESEDSYWLVTTITGRGRETSKHRFIFTVHPSQLLCYPLARLLIPVSQAIGLFNWMLSCLKTARWQPGIHELHVACALAVGVPYSTASLPLPLAYVLSVLVKAPLHGKETWAARG
jgi:hypothetical protein